MSKFKVGDKIRRTGATLKCVAQFDTLTVSCLSHCGTWLGVVEYANPNGDNVPFLASNFELVQAASEQPAVITPLEIPKYLTPQEVTECIINEVPVQYQTSPFAAWTDLQCPKDRVSFYAPYNYRKRPTTILINGISVPAPASKKPDGGNIYCVNLADERVIALDARYAKSKHYWSTEAEAREALDAIMTSFSE